MEADKIILADVTKGIPLPDESVHCCMTSPPYWGQRNYGVDGQLGLEKTPEAHTEALVKVFREVRRILRPDGVLFLNYGDKYNSAGTKCSRHWDGRNKNIENQENLQIQKNIKNLADGNLIGLAWRLAFALQGFAVLSSDLLCKWADLLRGAEQNKDWDSVRIVRQELEKATQIAALIKDG